MRRGGLGATHSGRGGVAPGPRLLHDGAASLWLRKAETPTLFAAVIPILEISFLASDSVNLERGKGRMWWLLHWAESENHNQTSDVIKAKGLVKNWTNFLSWQEFSPNSPYTV